MMERMHSWILRSVEYCCLIICLFLLNTRSTYAKEVFLSIACCAESAYTDNGTTLFWIPDNEWFPDKKKCHNITTGGAENDIVNNNFRTFDIDSGKRCYDLPTTENQDYLIRATFPWGDPAGSSDSSFDILIGVTSIGVVNLSTDHSVEAIFKANDRNIDFCLSHEKGDPEISKLELRPLNDPKYSNPDVLKVVKRVDAGNTGDDIRFPDDPFDRIWQKPDPSVVSESEPTRSNTSINGNTTLPLKVLQTALTHTDRLVFLHNDLDSRDYNYSLLLYFLELNSTVKTIGQRVFDIYVNNELRQSNFEILADGSNYREATLNVTANGSLNLTLVKATNRSEFGPIVNAYEILQVRRRLEGTNQEDVDIMEEVKSKLLVQNQENQVLESWSGDPCRPLPWKGLECHYNNGAYVISKLNISSSQFVGPIPVSITGLAYLREMNLSHNKFTEKIPEFPLSSKLTSVDLSYNDLTGVVPDSLVSLQNLTALYYRCNKLTKQLPSSFNSSKLATDFGACPGQGSRSRTQGIVIGTILTGSFLVTMAVGVFVIRFCRKRSAAFGKFDGKSYPMAKNVVFSLPSNDDIVVKSINIQLFPLEYIECVTRKYKALIGEGGFGSVYRGTLLDGQEVAVKVRSSTSTQGTKEFENELNLLSAIRHENLVPLLGYCSENDQQILVYPFMSNGSLQDRLYGEAAKRKILDWPTRLSIALGAARGLTYLHTFAGRCVIHRDVKSSNILLDNSMNAKVADFGFSKYAPQEGDSGASLEVRGTAGYLDPEYYSTQHLSAKSDVFSFGVVLLEIISGREPLNIHRPRNEWSLVEWAKLHIRESKIDEIVDPNIKGGYHAEAMWRVVEIALSCIEPFSAYRPCMADILRELEDALIIENNASEYMKSIDSIYSLGGSNRFSIVAEKKITLQPPTPTPTEPSPVNTQPLAPPEPR